MTIPPFDPFNNVIPPHRGNPGDPLGLTPHRCTCEELCVQMGRTPERKQILAGLLDLRTALRAAGISGFQWIGGSFVEDVEIQRGRPPRDVDVVTFAKTPDTSEAVAAAAEAHVPSLLDALSMKKMWKVDHYLVPLSSASEIVVDRSRYWCGLFSHRRGDELWKGMLEIPLDAGDNDTAARQALQASAASLAASIAGAP